jgi:hypothetical protein
MCEDVHFDLRSASASQYSQSVIWCDHRSFLRFCGVVCPPLSLSLSGDCCFADMVLDRVTRPYRFNKLLAGSMCITPAVWHLSGIYSCLLMSAFYVIVLSLRMIFLLLLLLYSILVCVQCRVQLQQPD